MPNLNHLWQRFLLASSLLVGLAVGVAATVFGYSNLASVDVRWSVFHINGIPLWTVAVVPLALTLIAGTLYHWVDSLHHFTEHMRHRRRVHELEAELASLRARLDQVLEMPDHSVTVLPAKRRGAVSLPAADEAMAGLGTTEAATAADGSAEVTTDLGEAPKPNGDPVDAHRRGKGRTRATLPTTTVASEPESRQESEPAPSPGEGQ